MSLKLIVSYSVLTSSFVTMTVYTIFEIYVVVSEANNYMVSITMNVLREKMPLSSSARLDFIIRIIRQENKNLYLNLQVAVPMMKPITKAKSKFDIFTSSHISQK